MATSPTSDLASFPEGMRFLARRPGVALGMAALGMLLAQLAPLLQLRVGLPNNERVVAVLGLVMTLPLKMYLVPRFILEADAHAGNPLNPEATWSHQFEARWIPAMAGRILLYLAAAFGFVLFVVPMFIVLILFGWSPLRMLLKGEGLADAWRGSYALMARAWRRVLPVVLALVSVYLVFLLVLSVAEVGLVQGPNRVSELPSAWVRLTHPVFWISNGLGSLLNLWSSAILLALFRRIDTPVQDPEEN
jgi:hypothetical protein